MLTRLLAALGLALLLVRPAIAADLQPADIVAELYAADTETPEPAYSARLQALFDANAARTPEGEVGALDFDWVTGGQDDPQITGLKIETVSQSADAATIRVTFRNYGEPRIRVLRFVVENGGWLLDDVELSEPEKTTLSAILRGR